MTVDTKRPAEAGLFDDLVMRSNLMDSCLRRNDPADRNTSRAGRQASKLPAEVSEGLVGLCHFVGIEFLLHSGTGVLMGFHDLGSEFLS